MFKVNRRILVLFFSFIAGMTLSFSDGEINSRLQKKIQNAIRSTYEVDTSVLRSIPIHQDHNSETPAEFRENNLFEIYSNEKLRGYLYLGEAPSMKRKFDYIILFNLDFTIKKSKVLIYREEHGRQIGSQRWLRQFIGMSTKDDPTYGQDIDAISGATISATSMTQAIGDVLKSIQILQEKDAIK